MISFSLSLSLSLYLLNSELVNIRYSCTSSLLLLSFLKDLYTPDKERGGGKLKWKWEFCLETKKKKEKKGGERV